MDILSKQIGREIHFKDYWAILKDNIWLMVSCCIVIVSVVAITSFMKVPLYDARAKLLIKPQSTNVLPVKEIEPVGVQSYGYMWARTYFNTQYEIIKSRIIADHTVDKFNLTEHDYFRGSTKDALAKRIMKQVSVIPLENTNIVEIRVVDRNPKVAAFLANAVSEVYTWYNLESALEKTREAYDLLQEKLDSVRNQVSESQTELYNIAESEKLYIPKDISVLNSEKMTTLNSSYQSVRLERIDNELLLNQIDDVKRKGGSYLEVGVIGESPVVSSLYAQYVALEIELNNLKRQYKDKHPDIQKQLTLINEIKEKLDEEVNRIIARIRGNYEILKDREQTYLNSLNEVKEESIVLNKKMVKYNIVEQQTAYAENAYEMIQETLKQTDLLHGLRDNNVSILERAEAPSKPFSPKYGVNLMLSFVVSILFGISIIFLKEYLDTNLKTPDDLEEQLGLPILSMVPHTTEGVSKSSVKEAFNTLRTSLYFSCSDKKKRCLLVTSSIPKEGKTSIAVNLAKTLSQAGDRVIIFDCDFRRPMIHSHFNVERRNGISAYIVQQEHSDWSQFLHKMSKNLHIGACGPIPPDPPKLIGSEKFKTMLREAKEVYDWVIVDSPPVTGITDPVILSGYVDGIVLVVRRNAVDREIARRAIKSLAESKSPVLGVVFNDVDFQSAYYTRYYKYGYYYYYKRSEEPEISESEQKGIISKLKRPDKKV